MAVPDEIKQFAQLIGQRRLVVLAANTRKHIPRDVSERLFVWPVPLGDPKLLFERVHPLRQTRVLHLDPVQLPLCFCQPRFLFAGIVANHGIEQGIARTAGLHRKLLPLAVPDQRVVERVSARL